MQRRDFKESERWNLHIMFLAPQELKKADSSSLSFIPPGNFQICMNSVITIKQPICHDPVSFSVSLCWSLTHHSPSRSLLITDSCSHFPLGSFPSQPSMKQFWERCSTAFHLTPNSWRTWECWTLHLGFTLLQGQVEIRDSLQLHGLHKSAMFSKQHYCFILQGQG